MPGRRPYRRLARPLPRRDGGLTGCVPTAPSRTAPPPASSADLLLGDPRRAHPVAAFGRAAGAVERRAVARPPRARARCTPRCAWAARWLPPPAASRAARSLTGRRARADRGRAPGRCSAARRWAARRAAIGGGAGSGRRWRRPGKRLPHLCGRDPQALDETADRPRGRGVGGREHLGRGRRRPGVGRARGRARDWSGFRAVNTLDAMVGPPLAPVPAVRLGLGPAGRRGGLARAPG